MKPLILKLRKCVLLDATVLVLFIQMSEPNVVWAESLSEIAAVEAPTVQEETYTINFQNISMIEYVKFVSKISGTNFIFDEKDLLFPVTIVSEEPITVKNIMSTLIQVLRIHNLRLLEQNNNLVISTSTSVNQISTVVSGDVPEIEPLPPIVTRVFRLKNASPSSVATVIRPMTSSSAIIEVSSETRQLIVTDITTNVDKISQLLASLDAPHTHLEIDSYVVKHISPARLTELVTQIVTPFADGNALIFVPQLDTNTIFIVSTPYLIERSLTVMNDLDVPSREKVGEESVGPSQIFLYKIHAQSGEELVKSLNRIAKSLSETPAPPSRLVTALETVKWIPDSNSLLFFTDSVTIEKIKDILSNLDGQMQMATAATETMYIYKTRMEYRDKVQRFLDQIISNLDSSQPDNREIIRTLKNAKWIASTQSFLFQGSPLAISKIKDLLTSFELQENLSQPGQSTFFIYELRYANGEFVMKSISNLAQKLEDANSSDLPFLQTLRSVKWLKENNSILITGPQDSVERVKALIAQFDASGAQNEGMAQTLGKQTFLIYKVQNVSPEKLMDLLREVAKDVKADNLGDKDFVHAIQQMKWLKENNALYFSGYEQSLQKIEELLKKFDMPQEEGSAFFMYDLKYVTGDKVIVELRNIAAKLKKTPNPNLTLIRALENVTWVEKNNSLLITSTPEVIDQIKVIIGQFDISGTGRLSGEKTSFFMYKPQHRTVQEIDASLKGIYQNLKHSGLVDPDLLETLSTVQAVPATNSILFTGTPEALEKVKQLVERIDVPSGKGITSVENINFLIYNVQNVSPVQLLTSLKIVAADLQSSNLSDKAVATSILSAKIIPENNSILFTGSPETLRQIEDLIKQFDRPGIAQPKGLAPVEKNVVTQIAQGMRETVSQFAIYKPQYVSGEQLIVIFQDFKKNLIETNVVDKKLFDAIDNLRWIPKTSSLLISGDPEAIAEVEQLLKKFDVPSVASSESPADALFTQATNFLVYKLQYQTGDEIQNAIKKIGTSLLAAPGGDKEPLTEAITSLQWIEVTNSMLASGDSESLQKIKHLIENLDIPLKQVLIEVLVIETTLSNSQSFGLEWAARGQFKNRLSSSISNVSAGDSAFTNGFTSVSPTGGPVPSNIPISQGFDLGVIGNMLFHKGASYATIASLINALQVDTDTTIVMNPKIVTQDNKSATIFIGRNIPFVGSVTTSTIATVNTATNLEYRNIGVSLTITPVLGESDLVTLDIVNEISSAPQNIPETQAGQVNGITTSLNTMSTRVHVPDQHFLILSGMITDTKDHSKTGIPCLGGLPIIGAAFSNNSRDFAKANVIIFVRPHIINSYDDYRKVTEHQENLFRDELPQKDLKETYDKGIDLLKTYKDE